MQISPGKCKPHILHELSLLIPTGSSEASSSPILQQDCGLIATWATHRAWPVLTLHSTFIAWAIFWAKCFGCIPYYFSLLGSHVPKHCLACVSSPVKYSVCLHLRKIGCKIIHVLTSMMVLSLFSFSPPRREKGDGHIRKSFVLPDKWVFPQAWLLSMLPIFLLPLDFSLLS